MCFILYVWVCVRCLRRPEEAVPSLDLRYRWLWATIRALGTKPRVLWKVATSVLNLWDIISSFNVSESLILKLSFWLEFQFKKKNQIKLWLGTSTEFLTISKMSPYILFSTFIQSSILSTDNYKIKLSTTKIIDCRVKH